MPGYIIDEIEREYAAVRERHDEERDELLKRLREDEEFRETENELKSLGIALAKAEKFYGDETAAAELKKKRDACRKKFANALKRLGTNEKALLPRFDCELCKDTGYVAGRPCKCFYKKLKRLTFEELNIAKTPLSDFSDDTLSEECGLNKIYRIMKKYAEKFPNGKIKNFVFTGPPGCGKSFLASCVAGELEKKGYNTIFLGAIELNEIFLRAHLSTPSQRSAYMKILTDCDLLVIDDLGTEGIYRNVTIEYLLSLYVARFSQGKHTIITTNLSGAELSEKYNERFFSRITEKTSSAFISFDDVDLRRVKK